VIWKTTTFEVEGDDSWSGRQRLVIWKATTSDVEGDDL